jgi:hypothetical protein
MSAVAMELDDAAPQSATETILAEARGQMSAAADAADADPEAALAGYFAVLDHECVCRRRIRVSTTKAPQKG